MSDGRAAASRAGCCRRRTPRAWLGARRTESGADWKHAAATRGIAPPEARALALNRLGGAGAVTFGAELRRILPAETAEAWELIAPTHPGPIVRLAGCTALAVASRASREPRSGLFFH